MNNENNNIKHPKLFELIGRTREAPLLRLAAYYILLAIMLLLFRQIASEYYENLDLMTLEKFSDILLEGMNLMTHRDDVLITTFHIMATFVYILPVAWVYVITKKNKDIDESIVQTIILISIIVTGIMMMLEDNLARAFGMVAILTAVRYRVAVKDTKDAVYIFLSMAIGMANGLGVPHMGLALSVLVNIVFIVLWKMKVGEVVTSAPVSRSSSDYEHRTDNIEKSHFAEPLNFPVLEKQRVKELRKNGFNYLLRTVKESDSSDSKHIDGILQKNSIDFLISDLILQNDYTFIDYAVKIQNNEILHGLSSDISKPETSQLYIKLVRIDYK